MCYYFFVADIIDMLLTKYLILAAVALVVFLLFGCSNQPSETEFNSAADLTEARIAVTRYNPNVYYLEEAVAYEDTCIAF